MQVPLFAMIPIGMLNGFWWFIAALPLCLIFFMTECIAHFGALGRFGAGALLLLEIPALLVVFVLVTPWFYGWYGIAGSLVFGRHTTAKAKEKALEEAINAYRAQAVIGG